jgi:glycosyltransferase involved in cell wall biosynthesis
MRAYVDTVCAALAHHAPGLRMEVIELAGGAPKGFWGRGIGIAAQHWRARRARGGAIDLWHVLDGSQAHLARAFGSAPVVVTVHDVIPRLQDCGRFPGVPPLGRASRLFWRANGRALRLASALACVSAASARDVQRECGAASSRCHLVPLALRPSLRSELCIQPAERSKGVVLHVGSNSFYKNRRGVLRIFSRLNRQVAMKLWMAGAAPDRELLALVDQLGIGDRVSWVIDPEDAELARRYGTASLMLFPSRYEGFGWPVLEAMAFGLPVVVSDAGSLPEVVGPAAPTHRPDDHDAFVSSVESLLSNSEAAAAASARGLQRAAEFTEAALASRLLATYSAALLSVRSPTKWT